MNGETNSQDLRSRIATNQNHYGQEDDPKDASFSYQNIPSMSTNKLKMHKLEVSESHQIETAIDDNIHGKRFKGNRKSIEEKYNEVEEKGINDEDVVVRRPYKFVVHDSWNAACRKEVIRLLRNRIKASDYAGHGVSVGCCYPCLKPLDEEIIDEMR